MWGNVLFISLDTAMKTALIVIDLQNAFITPESADLPARIAAHVDASHYDLVLFPKFVNYP